jgi:hypothetical protein
MHLSPPGAPRFSKGNFTPRSQSSAKNRWSFAIKGHASPRLRMARQKPGLLGNLLQDGVSRFEPFATFVSKWIGVRRTASKFFIQEAGDPDFRASCLNPSVFIRVIRG